MGDIPAYKVIFDELCNAIKDGTYSCGSLLPTEAELENSYNVSRTTVRRAIGLLVEKQYVRVVQGKGSIVQDVLTTQQLNSISSITQTLLAKGKRVTTQGMSVERVEAPPFVAEAFHLASGATVYKLQRIQCVEDIPLAISTNYLRTDLVPGFENHKGQLGSLYTLLSRQYNIVLTDAVETLSAVSASFLEAQILQLPPGMPLLCSKRISNCTRGPVEYTITKLMADRYEYSVRLTNQAVPTP